MRWENERRRGDRSNDDDHEWLTVPEGFLVREPDHDFGGPVDEEPCLTILAGPQQAIGQIFVRLMKHQGIMATRALDDHGMVGIGIQPYLVEC